MSANEPPVVELDRVSVIRGGNPLLDGVDWRVQRGERWAIVGANGSGKTTLVLVASTFLWPSRGSVAVLGERLPGVDVRALRRRIGLVSAGLAAKIPTGLSAREVVLAGATGALAPWWDAHDAATQRRSLELLERVGCDALGERPFELLSSGERQRVQIARALMLEPELLLLDEPAAGLDLGAREALGLLLTSLNRDPALAGIVVVTHHVEEIAPGTSHALALRAGRVVAAGPAEDVVTAPVLSAAFDLPLEVDRRGERFSARAATAGAVFGSARRAPSELG